MKRCMSCPKVIDRGAVRCKRCETKRRHESGLFFGHAVNPFVEFNGVRYFRDKQGWRAPHGKGGERLHRAIWSANNGPIPKGQCVRYADGDPENNDPANLVLRPRGWNFARQN